MDADAADLLAALGARGWSLGTAESLTGGLLAATVVEVPGSSAVFAGSVVAYDPAVKISLLQVDTDLVARVGTVDEQVASQMAKGACRALGVDVALATTGVAGPGPSEATRRAPCGWPAPGRGTTHATSGVDRRACRRARGRGRRRARLGP